MLQRTYVKYVRVLSQIPPLPLSPFPPSRIYTPVHTKHITVISLSIFGPLCVIIIIIGDPSPRYEMSCAAKFLNVRAHHCQRRIVFRPSRRGLSTQRPTLTFLYEVDMSVNTPAIGRSACGTLKGTPSRAQTQPAFVHRAVRCATLRRAAAALHCAALSCLDSLLLLAGYDDAVLQQHAQNYCLFVLRGCRLLLLALACWR